MDTPCRSPQCTVARWRSHRTRRTLYCRVWPIPICIWWRVRWYSGSCESRLEIDPQSLSNVFCVITHLVMYLRIIFEACMLCLLSALGVPRFRVIFFSASAVPWSVRKDIKRYEKIENSQMLSGRVFLFLDNQLSPRVLNLFFSFFFSRGRFENKLRKNQTWSDAWLWTFFRKRTLLGNEILLHVFIFVLSMRTKMKRWSDENSRWSDA